MNYKFKNIAVYLLILYFAACAFSAVKYEKKTFFAVERARVESFNPKFLTFINISSNRYSRKDPVYYFHCYAVNVHPFGNNITFDFYFYEWLTNAYKPSFVELHYQFCTLLNKDPIFGATIKRGFQKIIPNLACPVPAGEWYIQNLTLDPTPLRNFPFHKGRIYLNMTYKPTGEPVANGYTDFEIKEMKVKVQT